MLTARVQSFALDLLGGTWAITGTGTKLSAPTRGLVRNGKGRPEGGVPYLKLSIGYLVASKL